MKVKTMSDALVRTYAAIVTAVALVSLTLWWRTACLDGEPRRRRRFSTSADDVDAIRPPLPDEVVSLLEASSLCYLSTHSDDMPHLCLMNFTYYSADEVIIMTTRADTMKYKQLLTCPTVAILVHDFPHRKSDVDSEGGKTYSITLHGMAKVQSGPDAERYRNLHLERNPGSAQFIVGDNIAVVTVKVDHARICNVEDRVRYWDRKMAVTS